MANDAQKQTLLNAASLIRAAEQLLVQASRASSDPAKLMQINTEYTQLDSFLSQLLHAQAIADDADFASATAALKQQAATLQAEESDIKVIVADVGKAAQIAGYIAQALSLIATL
jgi:phosphoribosylcarboxyaminoimidazole (NCAIR) mutase